MGGFGGEELGAQVARVAVGVAALAGLAEFKLGVGWEEALVVGGAAERFFAAGLDLLVDTGWVGKGGTYRVEGGSVGGGHFGLLRGAMVDAKG